MAAAAYRLFKRRMRDPRLSRCMLVSLVLVVVTAGPIARVRHGAGNDHRPLCIEAAEVVLKALLDSSGSTSEPGQAR